MAGFTEKVGGRVVCIVCRERDGRHMKNCAVLALDGHVRDLASHMGIFLSSMRDTLEAISRSIRGEAD